MPTRVAVIIPFRGDPALLQWTLEGYAQQILPPDITLEVLIGADGCPTPHPPHISPPLRLTTSQFPRMGAAAVRNALVAQTDAEILILGNADARPDPDMVAIHVATLMSQPTGNLVLGAAPWETLTTPCIPSLPPPTPPLNLPLSPPVTPLSPTVLGPNVFDLLLAETPLIFFYNQLKANELYDFRHAWSLNLSVRRADYLRAGGFTAQIRPVYYEDLAFGHALLGPVRKGIMYQPLARVTHRHPTTLDQYLNREELLGLMSPVLQHLQPQVFTSVHGNHTCAALAGDYKHWITMDLPMHRWIYARLQEWSARPASTLNSLTDRGLTLTTIYQMHIPLKRLAFRLGFLRGLDLVDDAHWQERTPTGLWRKHLELN